MCRDCPKACVGQNRCQEWTVGSYCYFIFHKENDKWGEFSGDCLETLLCAILVNKRKSEDIEMAEKLTKEDIAKIEAEIEHRKLVLRPQLIAAVKEARAQGDLSENFEYYAAKREKNQNEGRINYLTRMIRFANVIEDNASDDEVGLNKIVDVYFEDDDEIETYKIVTPIRGHSLDNRISIESPIGKALLKHKVGDRVYVKTSESAGYYVKITGIRTDDTDDDIRSF